MFLTTRWKAPAATESAAVEPQIAEQPDKKVDIAAEVPLPAIKKRPKKEKKKDPEKRKEVPVDEKPIEPKRKEARVDEKQSNKDEGSAAPRSKKKKELAGKDELASKEKKKEEDSDEGEDAIEKAEAKVTTAAPEAKPKPAPKTRENQHATRRAKNRKKKGKAEKDKKRLAEVKEHEKMLPEISATYLKAWAKKQDGGTEKDADPEAKEWHFSRQTQKWLLQHSFEPEKVRKDSFALLLRYLEGLRGTARDELETDAGGIVERQGKRFASVVPKDGGARPADPPPDAEEKKVRKVRLLRASKILAALKASAAAAAAAPVTPRVAG